MRNPSRRDARWPDGEAWRRGRGVPLLLLLALAWPATQGLWGQKAALAQDKAAGIFDDAPDEKKADAKKADEKKAETKKADEKKPADAATKAKAGTAPTRETIGFTQENVASQMNELEERMSRLAEALRSLEPENASRLKLALNFSREELILLQMKETQRLLKDAELNKAETEVRELLAKLEHLRDVLLAEDLDFQMKLARLRQMREALGQLERIIKEERRELTWTRGAIAELKNGERLKGRRADLEAVVRDQESIVRDLKAAIPADGKSAPAEVREAAIGRQTAVRKTVEALAGDPAFADGQPPHLKQADPDLGDALTLLATPDTAGAVAAADRGLSRFRDELERLGGRIRQSERAIEAAEFRRLKEDQVRNRGAADALAEVSARLGDSGVSLQKDLIRAGGAMQGAEADLDRAEAQPASEDQVEALKSLIQS